MRVPISVRLPVWGFLALMLAGVLGMNRSNLPVMQATETSAASIPAQSTGSPTKGPNFPGSAGAAQGFAIRSQTNEVLVDVRVWDRSGHPVTDLKQNEFKIFEDGVPQAITSFSPESIEQLQAASAESSPSPTIDLAKLPPDVPLRQVVQDHRLMVLFFDLTSMSIDDLMRAVKAAKDYVRSRMTPADLVAVVTYAYTLRIAQNFSNDRDELSKVLEAIEAGETSSLSTAATEGEPGSTNSSGQEVVTQDVSAAFTPDETEFNIFNTDEKLAAIESLAKMLRGIPGRKSVIHFSSGIERTGGENQAQLNATVDAANKGNVSLYTVDARGLAALPPGGDASMASPAGTAVYTGQAVQSQLASLEGSRETLASLSADTGGKTFYDMNDFDQVFRQVQALNSSYYLLAYSPTNTRADGRFRRIRVEVRRAGVKVEARPGYFAPKNFRQFTREDKELQLEQAMNLDAPFVDLPLAVETAYFRQPGGKFYVVLAAKIAGSAISFLKKSAIHETEFDFAWKATDALNRTAAALRDTYPVKLSGEAYEKVAGGNILYEGGFVLPAGKYRLKVVARENQSGKLGTFEQPLELPEYGDSGLALSSVVVSNQLQNLAATAPKAGHKRTQTILNPMEAGGRSILPSVTRVFRTDQSLYVYLESYAPKTAQQSFGASASSREVGLLTPSVAFVFFRAGVKISEAGPFDGKVQKSPGNKTIYFVQIPLQKFPPGRYWMQVNVLDSGADRVAFAHVPLAILKPPVVSSAVPSGN